MENKKGLRKILGFLVLVDALDGMQEFQNFFGSKGIISLLSGMNMRFSSNFSLHRLSYSNLATLSLTPKDDLGSYV
jgi:hypothetical protein